MKNVQNFNMKIFTNIQKN